MPCVGRKGFDMKHDREWMIKAACAGMDPEMFFVERLPKGRNTAILLHHVLAPAREVCTYCPVAEECLAYARSFKSGEHSVNCGMWGGEFLGIPPVRHERVKKCR